MIRKRIFISFFALIAMAPSVHADIDDGPMRNANTTDGLHCTEGVRAVLSLDEPAVESCWKERDSQIHKYLEAKIQAAARALVRSDRQLSCEYYFVVTKDGKMPLDSVMASSTALIGCICTSAVQSLTGNQLLDFPKGTHYACCTDRIVYSCAGAPNSTECPTLSTEEIHTLMKLPVEQIEDVLKLAPTEIHQKLSEANAS